VKYVADEEFRSDNLILGLYHDCQTTILALECSLYKNSC
jgi:hypothetical protein